MGDICARDCGIGHFLVRGCGIDVKIVQESGIGKVEDCKNVRNRDFLFGVCQTK